MDNNKIFSVAGVIPYWVKGLFFAVLFFLNINLAATGLLEDYFIFLENNKKGIRDADHHVVVPAMYDDLGWSMGAFHTVGDIVGYKENGLWGLMTLENKKISPPQFQNLYPLNRKQVVASKLIGQQELYGIIDLNGNMLLDFEYNWFSMFNHLIIAGKTINSQVRYGIMNQSFEEVVSCQYTGIKMLNNRFAVIMQDQWLGLVNSSGQVVLEPKYHEIKASGDVLEGRYFNNYEIRNHQNQLLSKYQVKDLRKATAGILVVSGSNYSQLYNTNGEPVSSYKQTEILDFESDKAIIKRHGLYGIIDANGTEVLAPGKKSVWIKEGFIGIQEVDGNWKLFDTNLNLLTKRNYQQILPATDGLFPVKRLDSWGFINDNGEEVIPPQYQEAEAFKEGAANARYQESWGVIDRQGNWLVKPRYDRLEKLDHQTYIFQNGTVHGMVNTSYQELYSCSNPLVATPNGVIEMSSDQKFGLVSAEGEKLLSLNYSRIVPLKEDPRYYLFEDDQGLGIFNIAEYRFFSDTTIQEMRTLDEGFIGVRINDQYGLIDLNGKLRIANRYEDIGVFSEDMLPVKIRGKWGYVDKLERLKVQPLYHTADRFLNGVAVVSINDKFGLLDKTGKIRLSLEYDRLERLPEGLFKCYQGQRAGLVDANGKMLIYPRYDSIEILENGNLAVSRNGKFGLVDRTGKTMIPSEYDEIVYDEYNDLYLMTKNSPWEEIEQSSDF